MRFVPRVEAWSYSRQTWSRHEAVWASMPPSFFMRWCIYQGWSVKQEQQPEREISLRGEVEDRIWRAMQNLWQGTLSIRFIQLSMVQTHTTWFMVGLFNLTPDFSQKKKCFGQCFHPRQLCRSAWKTWSSLGDFTDREIAVLACAMEELRVDFNIDAMKEVKVIQVDAWFDIIQHFFGMTGN